jgi:large subunit ribosomal protein L25
MNFTIKGEKRESLGKNATRKVRREKKLPAILYGPDVADATPLILDKKDIFNILKSESGKNTIFKIAFNSKNLDVMIKEAQYDVVTDAILHLDLIQIVMGKLMEVEVSVVLIGEAVGVKSEGGYVDYVTRKLKIECLPKNIPEEIEVDISELHLNQSIKVNELLELKGIKFLDNPETVIAQIQVPTAEEVEEEIEEEELIGEEEEPELISKEKPEGEEEEKGKDKEKKEGKEEKGKE